MNIAINRKRLGHLAVWTLRASRQEMVTYAVAMTAIYTAIIWLMLWVARDESPADHELTMYLAQAFCTSAYCFGCFFFMTRAFAVLGTKGGATAFLSLPASMTEKWLVRVLYSLSPCSWWPRPRSSWPTGWAGSSRSRWGRSTPGAWPWA